MAAKTAKCVPARFDYEYFQLSIRVPIRPASFSPPRRVSPQPGHRPFLDSIRGLAALWVVLSHLWIIPCGLEARSNWLGPLTNWTLYSHFAVDVFIVLSGYCLVLPVARDGALYGGAWKFYGRRARRILPPFYAALLFSVLVFAAIEALRGKPLEIPLPALLANALLLQDVLPTLNLFNGPFWSIAVEWQIYFLFPILVWILGRYGKRGVLIFALAVSGALTAGLQWRHPEIAQSCPWYLLLFSLGLCAGKISVQRLTRNEVVLSAALTALSLAGVSAVVYAHPITAYGGGDFGAHLPLIDSLAGLGAAAGLVWVSRSPQRFPLLSWRPLVSLGTWAYSLYLVHLPCLLLLNALVTFFKPEWRQPLPHVYALIAGLPLVFGAARCFYLAFEKPFLSRTKTQAGRFPVVEQEKAALKPNTLG